MKYLDDNGLLYVVQKIKAWLALKADKSEIPTDNKDLVNGAGYQTAAQVNTAITNGIKDKADKSEIPTNNNQLDNGAGYQTAAQVSSTVNTAIANKADKSEIPTNNNQLVNGAGYQTESQVNELISGAIGDMTGVSYEIVNTLPASGYVGTIYLISTSTTGEKNVYDEYIWVNGKWEFLGTTAADLSGYVKTTDLQAITNGEIDTIVA